MGGSKDNYQKKKKEENQEWNGVDSKKTQNKKKVEMEFPIFVQGELS